MPVIIKPKLIIAGPGSGKTHNLVNQIVDCIPNLQPNKILAAITYTNAATYSVKSQLEKRIKIPPNVFVGTTYSFFNSFILLPYATLYNKTDLDKIFVEYDVTKKATEIAGKKSFANTIEKQKYLAAVQSNILKKLLEKGVVPFDQIAKISADLIKEKVVRKQVGNKIQQLFIDEFQDATTHQYRIFDAIRKEKKTIMYKVGDPEQYISNHTVRGRKPPNFQKLPIITAQSSCDVIQQTINYRSSKQIVDFINKFNTQIQQVSNKGDIAKSSVNFIKGQVLDDLILKFQEVSDHLTTKQNFARFYLAFENRAYETVKQKYALVSISNEHAKSHSKLGESLSIISTATGLSRAKICLEYLLEPIQFRMFGLRLLRGTFNTEDELKIFFKDTLKLKLTPDLEFDRLFERVKLLTSISTETKLTELTTSIHKSKGLEADAVLVIAKTNNELTKWLETDKAKRYADKTDQLRLGFVAFSRAREVLCIACLEEVSKANKKKLASLNVNFV